MRAEVDAKRGGERASEANWTYLDSDIDDSLDNEVVEDEELLAVPLLQLGSAKQMRNDQSSSVDVNSVIRHASQDSPSNNSQHWIVLRLEA